MDAGRSSKVVCFADFQLDLRVNELRKNGIRLRVPLQSLQILELLVERPGEIVTRDQLQKKLWPNSTIVEFEHSINAAMNRLRQALGDSAETPRFIETLPRRGYRFMMSVETLDDSPISSVVERFPSLSPGHNLGNFEILESVGRGGMGEVYRAADLRLKREVAIKVLSPGLDQSARYRFLQEAQAASALNHPNIVTVYDVGETDGVPYIAMEFVAGKSLAAVIPTVGMPLPDALEIAVQIAGALTAAHAAGIIHRDLKPGNVMVAGYAESHPCIVKVVDFGLAKVTEATDLARGKTTPELHPNTEPGTIIGTFDYMSPEQAEGRQVDARSDIFSFGAILYEMVSGKRAFSGDSNVSTLAAILAREPQPLSDQVPADLRKIINRCLRKERERRYQHAGDVRIALMELKETGPVTRLAPSRRWALQGWVWLSAILVLSLAGAAWFSRGSLRKSLPSPQVVPLTSYRGVEQDPSFSPDGNQVVFSWNGERGDNEDIYIKLIGFPVPVRLTTDPAVDRSPAFSPDGRSIGFVRCKTGFHDDNPANQDHHIFILIPAIGGPERIVANIPKEVRNFDWLSDGKWVVMDGLRLLSIETGEIHGLTSPPEKWSPDAMPAVSPDGSTVAFRRGPTSGPLEIYVLDLSEDHKPKGSIRKTSLWNGLQSGKPTWTPDGREIIFESGVYFARMGLWRVPVSGSGTRSAERLPFGESWSGQPVISRDGKHLAYLQKNLDVNIWRLPLSGLGVSAGPPARIVSSTRWECCPRYSRDGGRIAFESERTGHFGIWTSDADGSNAMEIYSPRGVHVGSPMWSPDGQRLAFDMDPGVDIYVARAGGGSPLRLTIDSVSASTPDWSRDGKWIYFDSTRSGRDEIWRIPAEGGRAVQVTNNGGAGAIESPDGRFVYYTKTGPVSILWRMPINGGEEAQVLPSVFSRSFGVIDEGIYFIPGPADGNCSIQFLSFATGKVKMVTPISNCPITGFDVSPDGRFLLYTQQDQSDSDLMLVENFRY
jgi:serine/threonine protein kinase